MKTIYKIICDTFVGILMLLGVYGAAFFLSLGWHTAKESTQMRYDLKLMEELDKRG